MQKVTVTLEFDSMEDMFAALNGQVTTVSGKVAPPQLSVVEAPAPAAPAAPAPAPAPAAAAAPAAAPAAAGPDLVALKADLMGKLQKFADDNPTRVGEIAQFIHSYGVQRFSDIGDDQLVAFETGLREQFGV